MTFHVGQKVVCIAHAEYVINDLGFPRFFKGEILTVAGLHEDGKYGTFLIFHEHSPYHHGHVDGFRPLIERETHTGFAILEDILRRETLPADERRQPAQSGERS